MKNNISTRHYIVISLIVALCTTACRPKGDDLLSYGQNDDQAFYDANHSFAGEFKTFWTAMNENYGIWDYEQSLGIDWDEVYRTYLPKFEEFDKRQEKVTDDEFKNLYSSIIDSLHDGHMEVAIKNLHTGRYVNFQPNIERILRERGTENLEVLENLTNLDAYRKMAVGAYRVKEYDYTGSATITIELIETTLNKSVKAADDYKALVDAAGGPNATNSEIYAAVIEMKGESERILKTIHTLTPGYVIIYRAMLLSEYDNFYQNYRPIGKLIGVEFASIEKDIQEDLLGYIRYALFEGNIAYLRIGNFGLTLHFDPAYQSHDTESVYYAYQQAVSRVWHRWFDAIQTLHKSGELRGVIIDLRNNSGGAVDDYQYVLGALLPPGGWISHTVRMKNGIGRLDFGPETPFTARSYEGEHEVVNDRPIVVLGNCQSISMAENTIWGVKSQPNGCFIGTRTNGALSALNPEPEKYSDNYSGAFGTKMVTPIYGRLPKYICLFGKDRKCVEGYGFDPDIEVPLDTKLWQAESRDNQLEKAIDYVNSH